MYKEIKIHGFEISLDTDMDGAGVDSLERVTGCWINQKEYSGSLDLALALDGLEDQEGNFLPVSRHTLESIERWALIHGY